MADTDRLGYSRGVLDQLRASHEQLSQEELLDLVFEDPKAQRATIRVDKPHALRFADSVAFEATRDRDG